MSNRGKQQNLEDRNKVTFNGLESQKEKQVLKSTQSNSASQRTPKKRYNHIDSESGSEPGVSLKKYMPKILKQQPKSVLFLCLVGWLVGLVSLGQGFTIQPRLPLKLLCSLDWP